MQLTEPFSSITTVLVSTISEIFLKDFFSEFEDVEFENLTTLDAFTFPEEIHKRNTLLFWVLAVSK